MEGAGADENGDAAGVLVMFSEATAYLLAESADGLAQVAEVGDGFAETPAADHLVLGSVGGIAFQAGGAAELTVGAFEHDAAESTECAGVRVSELSGGVDTARFEFFRSFSSYAPYFADGDAVECLLSEDGVTQVKDASLFGVLFGEVVGCFGEGFGRGDADADSDACPLIDAGSHFFPPLGRGHSGVVLGRITGDVEKGFIYAIDFHVAGNVFERVHDAAGYVGVEGVVGGKGDEPPALGFGFKLKVGGTHFYAQRFCLGASGDDAAVIIREDDDGRILQIGTEDSFATGKEVVAVNQGVQAAHGWAGLCFMKNSPCGHGTGL